MFYVEEQHVKKTVKLVLSVDLQASNLNPTEKNIDFKTREPEVQKLLTTLSPTTYEFVYHLGPFFLE